MRPILFCLVMVAAASGVTSLAGAAPDTVEPPLIQLTEHAWQYSEGGYSSLVAVTGAGVLITDPANAFRAANMKAAISTLTEQPVKYVVLSHEHYDHVGGVEVFDQAQVVCHDNCADVFALDVMNMAPKKVDVTYKGFKSLTVGNLVVELHGFGPGDGVATTVVYLPQEKVAFSADMYEARELTNAAYIDDMNYLGVKKALNAMSEWDLRYAINAHQTEPSVQVLHENNRFVNEFYEKVYAVLTEALAEKGPEGAFGLLFNTPEIDMSDYKDWKNYDHLPTHVFRMLASIYHGG